MHRRVVLGSFAASLSMAISACSGGGGTGGGGGTPPPPPVITFSHTFPAGAAVAQRGTAWDIIGVATTLSGEFGSAAGQRYDTLRVDVTFAQDISNALPSPGQSLTIGTQLGVAILINSDGNATTGVYNACNGAQQPTPFEYYTVVGPRLPGGDYGLEGPAGFVNQTAILTSVSGHVFTQTFPLGAVGVATGPSIPQVGVEVGSANGADMFFTDCAPAGLLEVYTDSPNIM